MLVTICTIWQIHHQSAPIYNPMDWSWYLSFTTNKLSASFLPPVNPEACWFSIVESRASSNNSPSVKRNKRKRSSRGSTYGIMAVKLSKQDERRQPARGFDCLKDKFVYASGSQYSPSRMFTVIWSRVFYYLADQRCYRTQRNAESTLSLL